MTRRTDSRFLLRLATILLIAAGAAPVRPSSAGGGEAKPDAGSGPAITVESIAAEHKKIDDEIKSALISPFTAVASHYVEVGGTVRIGADEKGTAPDPNPAMPLMASMTFDGEAFWVEPVAGSTPPEIRKRTENGEPAPGPGTAVAARTKLGDDEVIGLGRFLMETSAQSGYGRILVYDPDSPARKAFEGLKWFEPNPALAVPATFKPLPAPEKAVVGTSRGLKKEFYRAGTFAFRVDGKPEALVALSGSADLKPGDALFVPFRDATTGKESYEVGRYLSLEYQGPDAEYVIDFNSATNPLCNYSPHYNCPIPPKENRLSAAIRAGEMAYPKPH